ncbi:saccharopine dehydrogenase family protein [Phormidesmis sp. 146-35]
MSDRLYDVVLYGASGFVGKQTVQYFANHVAPEQLRWAIAGRSRQKLEAVRDEVGVTVDVLVADSQDQQAIDAIVSQTRVILTTAGPFALYGNALVDACVRFKTHYVDITGETPWVRTLIDRYHEQAAIDGTRIIPCCGFDSVPSDLGTYLIVRRLQELGMPCKQVKAYFQAAGGFNGGTLASAFNLYDSQGLVQMNEPFLLNPYRNHTQAELDRNRDPHLPVFDPDLNTWIAPFFMGAVNTRIVRRSAALYEDWQEPYGADFTYQEYLKFEEPLAGLKAVGMTSGLALFMGALQQPQVRSLLQPILPQPGSGPSEQTMNEGWFSCDLIGTAGNGHKVQGLIRDQGDPGNRATVKFMCESALSLALQIVELPGGQTRGGILTPATGLGEVLAHRLQRAGMTIEVEVPTLD